MNKPYPEGDVLVRYSDDVEAYSYFAIGRYSHTRGKWIVYGEEDNDRDVIAWWYLPDSKEVLWNTHCGMIV